jgi:hypothetical protein
MTSDSRRLFGILGATAVAALVLATLLPTKWIPRTGHWEVEHFIAYFATTMILCIASRRPIFVAGSLIMIAGILEALQGLTPDRFPDFTSALCGAAGVISAATLVTLFDPHPRDKVVNGHAGGAWAWYRSQSRLRP